MTSSPVDVYVKFPTGRTAQYYVRSEDTIGTLCRKIAKEEDVKEEQFRLKYQGKILNSRHSMSYLGVRPETILKAEFLVPRPVTLNVTLPKGGGKTQLKSMSLDPVSLVIQTIADIIKENHTAIELKYDGRLVRGHTLLDAGLVDGSSVEAVLKATPVLHNRAGIVNTDREQELTRGEKQFLVPRPVTLNVTLPKGGGKTQLKSMSLDPVSLLIQTIADIIKENHTAIELKYDGRLVRGYTLLDAGLVDGSSVEAVLKASPDLHSTAGIVNTDKEQELTPGEKQGILDSFESGGRPVEVVFSFDTTGSMHSCLVEVRRRLKDCCTRLIQDMPGIRIGIIAHGDYCDDRSSLYVFRSVDLMSDVQTIVDFVDNVPASGGGDAPECYEWTLRKAQTLDWSENSAKAFVVIGDDVPHPPSYTDQKVFWKDELSLLCGMGVKVYGVQALDNSRAEPFYRHLADLSGGRYLRLKQFDLITDMFLAVCYNESNNEEDLQKFVREVEAAGHMDQEHIQMFRSLNTRSPSLPEETDSEETQYGYIAQAWWDPSLDIYVSPEYSYDQQNDTWFWIPDLQKVRDENRRLSSALTLPSPTFSEVQDETRHLRCPLRLPSPTFSEVQDETRHLSCPLRLPSPTFSEVQDETRHLSCPLRLPSPTFSEVQDETRRLGSAVTLQSPKKQKRNSRSSTAGGCGPRSTCSMM